MFVFRPRLAERPDHRRVLDHAVATLDDQAESLAPVLEDRVLRHRRRQPGAVPGVERLKLAGSTPGREVVKGSPRAELVEAGEGCIEGVLVELLDADDAAVVDDLN